VKLKFISFKHAHKAEHLIPAQRPQPSNKAVARRCRELGSLICKLHSWSLAGQRIAHLKINVMKIPILLLSILIALMLSCNNEGKSSSAPGLADKKTDTAKTTVADTKPGNGIISFKVNGSLVKTSAWNISFFSGMTGISGINITSNMHEDTRNINININGDTIGTYSLAHSAKSTTTRGLAYGSYRPDYLKDMMNSFHFESGALIIESIDKSKGIINASFSGKAKNNKGEEVEITEGKVINGKIKPVDKSFIN
jgi:hypothetical protein